MHEKKKEAFDLKKKIVQLQDAYALLHMSKTCGS